MESHIPQLMLYVSASIERDDFAMSNKRRILIESFDFFYKSLKELLSDEYKLEYYMTSKKSRFVFFYDYFSLKKKASRGFIKRFDVIHLNNYVAFNIIRLRTERQIWISESHGYHFGISLINSLIDSEFPVNVLGFLVGIILHPVIRHNMKEFDVNLVAIPNIYEDAKKFLPNVEWLPNPISDFWFEKHKNIKVDGSPAIFFPTRLHKMKEPEHGFKIFEKIFKQYPNAKLHLIKYPERFSQYFFYETFLEKHKERIVWHKFVKREKLAEMYHSFDLVLGAFGKGLLNLVELEAMASGAAVVSYDRYEFIKKEIEELPAFALKLLSDKKFKTDYVKHSKEYVKTVHGSEAVAEKYKKIIDSALKKKSSKD